MKKLLVLILLLAAGGGAWWWTHRDAKTESTFTTVAVTEGPMSQIVTATGTLTPVVNVTVGSQISGIIQELHADFNSSVKAGDVVAQLDPATYQATVNQAKGDVAQAEAGLELARLTADRKKELLAQKAAPQADVDAAVAALSQAKATVQIKRANLERAEVDLARCTIRSPIDGTVISRNVDVGQTVAASLNAPVLFTIANDLTKMQIYTAVAEADVGAATEGQTVDFSVDAFPYETFHGKVEQVRNAATTVQNIVTYNVVVSVDNPELKLKPGMTANVSIIVAHRDDAVKVPNDVLRYRPPEPPAGAKVVKEKKPSGRGERVLYVLPPGATEPQPAEVKLGISDNFTTEVLDGLKVGDLVVTGTTAPIGGPKNPLLGGGMRRR